MAAHEKDSWHGQNRDSGLAVDSDSHTVCTKQITRNKAKQITGWLLWNCRVSDAFILP